MCDIKCHTKPTETFQYLHRESSHPTSVFKSFIIGEMHRYLRNTNDETSFDHKMADFKSKLMVRGYSLTEINKCYRKLNFNDRKEILYGGIGAFRKGRNIADLITRNKV